MDELLGLALIAGGVFLAFQIAQNPKTNATPNALPRKNQYLKAAMPPSDVDEEAERLINRPRVSGYIPVSGGETVKSAMNFQEKAHQRNVRYGYSAAKKRVPNVDDLTMPDPNKAVDFQEKARKRAVKYGYSAARAGKKVTKGAGNVSPYARKIGSGVSGTVRGTVELEKETRKRTAAYSKQTALSGYKVTRRVNRKIAQIGSDGVDLVQQTVSNLYDAGQELWNNDP